MSFLKPHYFNNYNLITFTKKIHDNIFLKMGFFLLLHGHKAFCKNGAPCKN